MSPYADPEKRRLARQKARLRQKTENENVTHENERINPMPDTFPDTVPGSPEELQERRSAEISSAMDEVAEWDRKHAECIRQKADVVARMEDPGATPEAFRSTIEDLEAQAEACRTEAGIVRARIARLQQALRESQKAIAQEGAVPPKQRRLRDAMREELRCIDVGIEKERARLALEREARTKEADALRQSLDTSQKDRESVVALLGDMEVIAHPAALKKLQARLTALDRSMGDIRGSLAHLEQEEAVDALRLAMRETEQVYGILEAAVFTFEGLHARYTEASNRVKELQHRTRSMGHSEEGLRCMSMRVNNALWGIPRVARELRATE